MDFYQLSSHYLDILNIQLTKEGHITLPVLGLAPDPNLARSIDFTG